MCERSNNTEAKIFKQCIAITNIIINNFSKTIDLKFILTNIKLKLISIINNYDRNN